jgi:hypothetical protein
MRVVPQAIKGVTFNVVPSDVSLDNAESLNNFIKVAPSRQKANNTIQKGEDALAKNPDLQPSLPDPVVLDSDINKMIEDTKGIKARYKFSDIVAKRRGAGVRNFK